MPEADWTAADKLITRESSWKPTSVNPSSGACGLGQQLPCGKWPHQWDDPVGALVDTQTYIKERYGGWDQALNFHYANNWY